MKKLMAFLLTALMVLSMSAGVLAATTETTGTITIKNATLDTNYSFYRVFIFDRGTDNSEFNYTLNTEKWSALKTNATALEFFSVDDSNRIQMKTDVHTEEVWGAEFAAFLKGYVETNNIAYDQQVASVNTTRTATYDNAPFGYYLVLSSLGDVAMLDTTTSNAEINNKNPRPFLEKLVYEDNNPAATAVNGWGVTNDADIGEDVKFRIVVGIDAGDFEEGFNFDHKYTVHDTLDSTQWTSPTISEVYVYEAGQTNKTAITTTAPTDGSKTRYYETTTPTNGDALEIVLHNMKTNDTVYIEYTAKLTNGATVASTGNKNTAKLTFNSSDGVAASSELLPADKITTTFTWNLPIFKYTGQDTPLEGAKFVLSKTDGETTKYAVVGTDGKFTEWTANAWDSTDASATTKASVLTSGSDGDIKIIGLDSGTFSLVEIEAPATYNRLVDPIAVVITSTEANGMLTSTMTQDGTDATTISVQNNTGTPLPATGGIGTTLFYVLGAVLVLGVAVVFTVRRRMSVEG